MARELNAGYVRAKTEEAFDKLFEDLDDERGDMAPSELAKLLDKTNWGLGDDYREWFEEGDEEWT